MAPGGRPPSLAVIGQSRSLDSPCSSVWVPGLCRTLSDFRGRRTTVQGPARRPDLGEEVLRRSTRQLGESPGFLVRTGSMRTRRFRGAGEEGEAGKDEGKAGKEEGKESSTCYMIQSGCYVWTGRSAAVAVLKAG